MCRNTRSCTSQTRLCERATSLAVGGLPFSASVRSLDNALTVSAEPGGLAEGSTEPVHPFSSGGGGGGLSFLGVGKHPGGPGGPHWAAGPGTFIATAGVCFSDPAGAPPGTPALTSLSVPFALSLWSLRTSRGPCSGGIPLERPVVGCPSTSRHLLSTDTCPASHTEQFGGWRGQHGAPGKPLSTQWGLGVPGGEVGGRHDQGALTEVSGGWHGTGCVTLVEARPGQSERQQGHRRGGGGGLRGGTP